MQNLEFIISLAATAICFLATAITFITRFVKAIKEKRTAQSTLRLCNALAPLITEAEKFTNYNGQEKKEFVLTRANQFALQNRIKFDTTWTSQKIDEIVHLTRQVNGREKLIHTKNNFTHGFLQNSSGFQNQGTSQGFLSNSNSNLRNSNTTLQGEKHYE